MTQQPFTFLLGGGLDVETPSLALPAGAVISAVNYQSVKRGYKRELGYERYDGRALASAQVYSMLGFTAGNTSPAAGTAINGETSGATAWILAEPEIASGTIAGGDAAGQFPIFVLTGTFADGENIRVGTTGIAVCDGGAVLEDADDETTSKTYVGAAADLWRATIGKPSGSGPVRGVFKLNGDVYCFRDNAGATAAVMFKATTAGWVAQTFGSYIPFDTATAAPAAGETVTGPSGTAVIDRVIDNDGAYADAGGAAGYLVVHSVTGTFSAGQNLTTPGGGVLKASGPAVAITLPAGGRYDCKVYNFYGTASLTRAYCANGVGRAFEWDGSVLVPIWTGISDALDKPTHVSQRSLHLFLAYQGGSVQFSSIGTPTIFNAVTGAGEVGFGVDITDMIEAASTALMIYGESRIGYITGTNETNFAMSVVTSESGAMAWTAQSVMEPVHMDAGGIRGLSATDTTGGWAVNTKADQIKSFLDGKRRAGVQPVASAALPDLAQYRVFLSDGSGISLYLGREKPEPMPFEYGFVAHATWAGKGSDLSDEVFVAADDGYVYRLFSGTSFDGETIDAFLRLAYNNINTPMQDKRFHGILCHVDSPGNMEIGVSADFSYGDDDVAVSTPETTVSLPGGGGYWNEAVWDRFVWSAPVQAKLRCALRGKGENISVAFVSSSALDSAHTLTSATIFYSPLRQLRVG